MNDVGNSVVNGYVGEVRLMGFDFAPVNWVLCDGRVYPQSLSPALCAMLGSRFGGDGRSSFGVPNLGAGRVVLGTGSGPGLTPRKPGDSGGVTTVTLTDQNMPPHTHRLMTVSDPGDVSTPTSTSSPARSSGLPVYRDPGTVKAFDGRALSDVPGGGGGPHNNVMPYQALLYCICYFGH
jgi:microcystin-dependent protein